MSVPAFYLPPAEWGGSLKLTGSEFNHFRVLRLREGEKAILLDGAGREAVCEIVSIDKKDAFLKILSERTTEPPRAKPIMALALSKAVRRDFFMEKAAELGAWAIWLWRGRRSQGTLDEGLARSTEARLIAGIKQSHNPWLPQVGTFADVEAVIAASVDFPWRVAPWEDESASRMATTGQLGQPGETIYVVGPEGGFADEEIELLRAARFETVSFGKRVLRCETAAVLCLGLHWWASQLPGGADFDGGGD